MPLAITSPAFANHAPIPKQYTCDGKDMSPPLEWSGVPSSAKSLALIVDDPDAPDPNAPKVVWVHWVVYDIPLSTTSVKEGASPAGAKHGSNDWKKPMYGGPCPPIGRHRYFFKLYALDTSLGDLRAPNKAALEQAMKGHIVAEAELVGTYQR